MGRSATPATTWRSVIQITAVLSRSHRMETDLNLSLCRHEAGPGRDLQRDIAMKISNGSQDLAALSLKTVSARTASHFAAVKNFASVALNPQPLPPTEAGTAKKAAAFGNSDAVALNPQPLPPKEGSGGAARRDPVTKALGDCASTMEQFALDSIDHRSKMASTFSNLTRKLSDTADRKCSAHHSRAALRQQATSESEKAATGRH